MNGPAGEVPILVYTRARRPHVRDLGPGHRARRRDLRALRGARHRPDPRRRPARRDRAGRARRLVPACSRSSERCTLEQVLAPARALAERGFPMYPFLRSVLVVLRAALPRRSGRRARRCTCRCARSASGRRTRRSRSSSASLVAAERAASGCRETRIRAARDSFYRGRAAEEIEKFLATPVARRERRARTRACSRADDLARYEGAVEDAGLRRLPRRARLEVRAVEPGPRVPAAAPAARGLRPRGAWARTRPTRCTPGSSARSSPSPTARPATAIRASRTCRSPSCSRTATPRCARAGRPQRARRSSCVPGLGRLPRGWPLVAGEPAPSQEPQALAASRGRGDTTHLDAVDRDGNLVSATPSGAWIPSSPVIPALGFPIGTRAQMFVLDPEHPNALAPGQAPAHDAHAVARAARRRAAARVRHAGRRPAGPVDACRSS